MVMNENKDYLKYLVGLIIISAIALVGCGFLIAAIEITKKIF